MLFRRKASWTKKISRERQANNTSVPPDQKSKQIIVTNLSFYKSGQIGKMPVDEMPLD